MQASPVIRLVLADDHMMVRRGLALVIGGMAGIEVVGEAANGREALEICAQTQPDVVVMDVMMPLMGGIEAARALGEVQPAARVIALSSVMEAGAVRAMYRAGARAFLVKTCEASTIEDAIRRVHNGEVLPPPEGMGDELSFDFSPQQRKVLALVAKGFSNPEIAQMMGISMPTARYHVGAILAKLGASNRAEAAAMAMANNLVSPDDI